MWWNKVLGCQDRGCIFCPPQVGTCGGCRCLDDLPSNKKYAVKAYIENMKDIIRKKDITINQLREIISKYEED